MADRPIISIRVQRDVETKLDQMVAILAATWPAAKVTRATVIEYLILNINTIPFPDAVPPSEATP